MTKLEHAKSNIQFGRMKVATFSDANDPFELLALNLRGRTNRSLRKALNQFKKDQTEEAGMLCFSRSWGNPVLWSHYAAGHKGACLGFDVKQETLEDVKYADDLLRARLGDDEDGTTIPNDLQQLLLVTKFRHWQYEDEVRRFVELSQAIFDEQKKVYYWPFDDAMILREVILGPLCPKSELESIRSLVRQANSVASVSRARLAFGRFEVRPDGRYPPG